MVAPGEQSGLAGRYGGMTRRSLILIVAGLVFLLLFPLLPAAQVVGKPVADVPDTVARSYPERLVKDFPIIYNDTAYTAGGCHVVVRAVFTACRTRKVRVRMPEPLPCPEGGMMVRFESPRQEKATCHSDMTETHRK